jgi:hypothetical protein
MKAWKWTVLLAWLVLPATWLTAQVTNAPVDTNAPPVLPGLTGAGQVDVVNLINLAILALTPIVMQGFKKLVPKLPDFTLNLLAPLLGAGLGSLLHVVGVSTATGWGAAIWGGLGTWLYELSHNARFYVSSKLSADTTAPTPPAK